MFLRLIVLWFFVLKYLNKIKVNVYKMKIKECMCYKCKFRRMHFKIKYMLCFWHLAITFFKYFYTQQTSSCMK